MDSSKLTKESLAKLFDHTFLKAYATNEDLKTLCDQAKTMNTAMVAINTAWTAFCKKELAGTDVHVGAAIGFPFRTVWIGTKLFECNVCD